MVHQISLWSWEHRNHTIKALKKRVEKIDCWVVIGQQATYPILVKYWNTCFTNTQVRIAEVNNTAKYWPNLGSQQSAIVIGPVSQFALVKRWADDGGLCRLCKFADLQLELGTISALYQAYCHFYYGIQFRKYKSQNPAYGRYITGPCVQVHTGVIIPATARFRRCWASVGPYLNSHLGSFTNIFQR